MLWAFLEWIRQEKSFFLAFFFLGLMLLTLIRVYAHPFFLPVITLILASIYREKKKVILVQRSSVFYTSDIPCNKEHGSFWYYLNKLLGLA